MYLPSDDSAHSGVLGKLNTVNSGGKITSKYAFDLISEGMKQVIW